MGIPVDNPVWLIAAVAACFLIWWAVRSLGRREPGQVASDLDLAIDVTQLDDRGPPPEGPRIEFYGTPVRVAVVVVAPVGRDGEMPPADILPGILERTVPGLAEVISCHQPIVRRWPAQLSSHGFAQSFFNHVRLPGNRGKGTPWCSLAGRIQVGDRSFLVGIAFSAATSNALGQLVVEHEGMWLDILRIHE